MKNVNPSNPNELDDLNTWLDGDAAIEETEPPIETVSHTVMLGDDAPAEEPLDDDIHMYESQTAPSKPNTTPSRNIGARLRKLFTLRHLAVALCALVIGVIVYYILFPSRGYFHSDSADTQMWAKASYDSGSLLNPDFNYACLLPFGGQLLMVPLIALFGVSMTTQVIGMLLFFALFVASLFFLFRQMKWGLGSSCLSVAIILMILSGSDKLREIFWGHVIYYSLGLFFLFVGLGLTFKIMNCLQTPNGKATWLWVSIILLVWCVLASANQVETITLFTLPLLCGLIAERFFSFDHALKPREKMGAGILITIVLLGMCIGYLLGNLINGDIVAGYAGAFSNFSGSNSWGENAGLFFSHWFSLFGVDISDGDQIASPNGILNVIRIFASLLLLIAPIVASILYPKIKDRASRIIIWAHWVVTAILMVGFIFGRLSAANWRLSPLLGTCLLVTMVLCRWVYAQHYSYRRVTCVLLIPLLIVGSASTVTMATMSPTYKQDSGLYAIADAMAENGWNYGYATFWNANALTVISDSKVECRSITIDGAEFKKYTYQQENSWFDDQEGQDTYFVLLSGTEYNSIRAAGNPLISTAKAQYTINEYYVLLYDHNIF